MKPICIGEGFSGCVFWPPLKSKSFKGHEFQVGKVTQLYKAKREVWAAGLYKQIDPNHEFTLPFFGAFPISKKTLGEIDKDGKCHVTNSNDGLAQLIFAKGGRTLQNIIDSGMSGCDFDSVYESLISLMKGLVKMSDTNLCHCDIKPDNLLCYEGKIFLIDYGTVKRSFRIFVPKAVMLKYQAWYTPPEGSFFIHQNLSFEKIIRQISQPLLELANRFHISPEFLFAELQIRQLSALMTLMHSQTGRKTMIRHAASKQDIYRLGMIIKVMSLISRKSSACLDKLIGGMTDMNPQTRYSAAISERLYVKCLHKL